MSKKRVTVVFGSGSCRAAISPAKTDQVRNLEKAMEDTAGLPPTRAMLRMFRSFLVDGAQYVPPEPISDIISADLRPLRVPQREGVRAIWEQAAHAR